MNDLEKIRRQLVWDRLLAIVEDQAQTLMRTAFSTVVREAGDLSAGVFDERGRMLAQAVTGTPGHVNAMARSVNNFLEVYPLEILRPGDVLVTNDPWLGTGHLNDFTVLTPVFYITIPSLYLLLRVILQMLEAEDSVLTQTVCLKKGSTYQFLI